MNKQQADKIIASYVKKIFGFSMSRLSSIDEAQELSQKILLEVYEAFLRQDIIENPDGYVYRIARNVYSRHIDSKNKYSVLDGIELIPDNRDFTEDILKSESYGVLRREITYLSKIQREIIVLYYFHGKKVKEIASFLKLNENTVKWHLACSRKELKTGMETIRTTGSLGTEPIRLINMGHSGCAGSKGDTADFLSKVITQNIAYAAYHQPRTINEIAQELGINPIFVEDEVAVLEEYGFMDKLSNGKYRTNIHLYEVNETIYRIYSEIDKKFPKLLAQAYFAPALESITQIPEWLSVPDDDINLLRWCLVCFMSDKLALGEYDNSKFSVKRPDGGDFIAFAQVLKKLDFEVTIEEPSIYGFCGHMWRENFSDNISWKSWQFNCHWTDRASDWRENRNEDYDKLYFWLNGLLPGTVSNAENYARLLEKGYILKEGNEYKSNIILCDSEDKWWEFIPEANSQAMELSREYVSHAIRAELCGQPEHMHELIRHLSKNATCKLYTRIMKELLDMGVLKEPTEKQAKGLCTIMFRYTK